MQLPIERARELVQTKVRILRLNTYTVGEFDLKALDPSISSSDKLLNHGTADGWAFRESEMPHKFLPYSRYVFLDLETILGLGGLDDTHPTLPAFFTNYVYDLSLVDYNADD